MRMLMSFDTSSAPFVLLSRYKETAFDVKRPLTMDVFQSDLLPSTHPCSIELSIVV